MTLSVRIYDRDGGAVNLAGWSFEVQSMSVTDRGPESAELVAVQTPGEHAEGEVFSWLGYQVEIVDDVEGEVWHGDIVEASASDRQLRVRQTTQGMGNSIIALYTDIDGLSQTLTDSDADSVDQYGQHDRILSMSRVTSAGAQAAIDAYLATRALPLGEHEVGSGGPPRLRCVGPLASLARRQIKDGSTAASITVADNTATKGFHVVAQLGASQGAIAQSLTNASTDPWAVTQVTFYVGRNNGSVAQNLLEVALWSDAAGQPGVELEAVGVSGISDISPTYSAKTVNFSGASVIEPGEKIWLLFTVTASTNGYDIYGVTPGSADAYTGGSTLQADLSVGTWTMPITIRDIYMSVTTRWAVARLIRDTLELQPDVFQFISISDVAEVALPSARSGYRSALDALEEFLRFGSSDGRPLVVRCPRRGQVVVEPQPSVAEALTIDPADGTIYDEQHRAIPLPVLPRLAGRWLKPAGRYARIAAYVPRAAWSRGQRTIDSVQKVAAMRIGGIKER